MSAFTVPFSPATPAAIPVVPVAGLSPWLSVIVPGTSAGLALKDTTNSKGVIETASLITNSTRLMFRRATSSTNPLGTTMRARLIYPYDAENTQPDVSPVIRVFGGDGTDKSKFSVLRNLNGDASVLLATDVLQDSRTFAAPDPNSPSVFNQYRATIPNNTAHAWDCDGYEYFVIGVERALSYLPGADGAALQIKFV